MTTPAPDLSFIIPKKWKSVAALIGSALSFVVPYVLTYTDSLPQPWPGVIGFVLFVLTVLGVYHAPYAPKGTVLVQDPATPPAAGHNPAAGQNPYL